MSLLFWFLDVNFDVNKAIQQLTDTLGKYGPVVWDAVIRQVYVNAVTALVWMVAFAVFGVFGYRLGLKWLKMGFQTDGDETERIYQSVGGGMLLVAALIAGPIGAIVNLINALQDFINPVWAAVQMLKQSAGQ